MWHAGAYLVTEWIYHQVALNSWFITGRERQQSMLSILNRVMPGGGGRDLDLILDNDTIQTHMGKSGATFPRGSRRGGR